MPGSNAGRGGVERCVHHLVFCSRSPSLYVKLHPLDRQLISLDIVERFEMFEKNAYTGRRRVLRRR